MILTITDWAGDRVSLEPKVDDDPCIDSEVQKSRCVLALWPGLCLRSYHGRHLVDTRRQKKWRAAGNRCAPTDCGIDLVDIW